MISITAKAHNTQPWVKKVTNISIIVYAKLIIPVKILVSILFTALVWPEVTTEDISPGIIGIILKLKKIK